MSLPLYVQPQKGYKAIPSEIAIFRFPTRNRFSPLVNKRRCDVPEKSKKIQKTGKKSNKPRKVKKKKGKKKITSFNWNLKNI